MAKGNLTSRLDALMVSHPAMPRMLPYMLYLVLLIGVGYARDAHPLLYPITYAAQCAIVGWLLWRYRKLTPELTVRFHWLAVPVGVLVFVLWVGLRWAMEGEWSARWAALQRGQWLGEILAEGDEPHFFATMLRDQPAIAWASLALRLLGMAILVPLFEELFIRSLVLRSFHRARESWLGLLQFCEELPFIGDMMLTRGWSEKLLHLPPMFRKQFENTPLGHLTVLGVVVSTLVFMLAHVPGDWPGTIACGIAYCLLLAATARKGLGPVVWAHGITNALLLVYCVTTGDLQML